MLLSTIIVQVEPRINQTWSWDFWTGVDPICMNHSEADSRSLYDNFPIIELDLYTADYKSITLAVSPQQYLRPVVFKPGQDCYKVGVTSSTQGTNIGKYGWLHNNKELGNVKSERSDLTQPKSPARKVVFIHMVYAYIMFDTLYLYGICIQYMVYVYSILYGICRSPLYFA